MYKLFIMTRKEVLTQTRRPFFWLLLGVFALILGIVFFNLLVDFHERVQKLASVTSGITLEGEIIQKFYGNFNFLMLFFVPLLAMNSFISEKQSSTLEMVLGTSVKSWQIIGAKFLGQVFNLILMLMVALPVPLLILSYGHDDILSLMRGHFAIFLNSLCYLWITLVFSFLMDSSVLVAVSSLISVFLLWLASWFSHNTSNFLLAQIFDFMGLTRHFQNVIMGTVYLSDLSYYLSFSLVAFLVLWHLIQQRETV